jgi:hypothetical protein
VTSWFLTYHSSFLNDFKRSAKGYGFRGQAQYAAVRDDVILTARIFHANTDMQIFLPMMKSSLSRTDSVLQTIAAARGRQPVDKREIQFASVSQKDYKAVTLHEGTPYELQAGSELLSSMSVFTGLVADIKLKQFAKRVSAPNKKWTPAEILQIAFASSRVSTVARTIDFNILRYEFLLANNNAAENDGTNGRQCILLAVVAKQSGAEDIVLSVYPYLKDKALSGNDVVTRVFNEYKRNPKLSRLSHIHKMQILPTSPIPTVTGRREMVAIGNFWMTKSYYAEASEHKDLDQCLRSIGLDRQHRESFFRRALESCGQSKNYLEVDDARLTPYKILIRHPTIIENKEFTVWIGHHGDHARNLILYANIVPGWNARPSERGDVIRDRLSKMPELIALSNPRINDAIALDIPLPERPSPGLFNLVLDGKNRVFRPMGNFIVGRFPPPQVYELSNSRKKQNHNFDASEERNETADVVTKCRKQFGADKFLVALLTKAQPCLNDEKWRPYQDEEKHFTIHFYDKIVSGHAFKLAILTPAPYYRNLAVAFDLELARTANAGRMLDNLRRRQVNFSLPIMVAINKMKKRGETLPEEVTIPEHVKQKQQRIADYRGDVNDEEIDDEIDDEIHDEEDEYIDDEVDDVNEDDDDENIDDDVDDANESDITRDNMASNRPAEYQTFPTVQKYYETTIAGVADREQIKTRIHEAIDRNPSLRSLRTGLARRSEHTQLIALGELWSTFAPNPTQRSSSRQDMAAAMAAALEIVDFANEAFHPDLGITFAVSGNVFEPAVRMDGEIITYEDIIKWADQQPDGGIQAAGQMLTWMNGRTTLANLPRHLRMLAVHTHYVDTGRDRSNVLDGLKTRMEKISGGTLTQEISWNTLGDVYAPIRSKSKQSESTVQQTRPAKKLKTSLQQQTSQDDSDMEID